MCLPCWPWSDIYIEKRVVNKDEEEGVLAWDPNARSMILMTGVKTVKAVGIQISFIITLFLPFATTKLKIKLSILC